MGSSQNLAGAPRARPAFYVFSTGRVSQGKDSTDIVDKNINLTKVRYGCLDSILDLVLILDVYWVDGNLDVGRFGNDFVSHVLKFILDPLSMRTKFQRLKFLLTLLRDTRAMLTPCSARSLAVASPMPIEAPV